MRKGLLLFVVILSWLIVPVSAGPTKPDTPLLIGGQLGGGVVATAGQSVGWDYTDAQIASGAVIRFETQYDAGAWTAVGMVKQTGVATGSYMAPLPALTTGSHTVSVRACNASMCGDGTTPLAFTLSVKPGTPGNVRIIGG